MGCAEIGAVRCEPRQQLRHRQLDHDWLLFLEPKASGDKVSAEGVSSRPASSAVLPPPEPPSRK
jgi:hypothetical protein